MMKVSLMVAALQSAPPVAIPPPPAVPVVVWVEPTGSAEIAHVVLLNPMKEIAQPVAQTLYGKLYTSGRSVSVDLHRVDGDSELPAGGYATEQYSFSVPADVSGDVVLSFSNDGDGYRFQVAHR